MTCKLNILLFSSVTTGGQSFEQICKLNELFPWHTMAMSEMSSFRNSMAFYFHGIWWKRVETNQDQFIKKITSRFQQVWEKRVFCPRGESTHLQVNER